MESMNKFKVLTIIFICLFVVCSWSDLFKYKDVSNQNLKRVKTENIETKHRQKIQYR